MQIIFSFPLILTFDLGAQKNHKKNVLVEEIIF